MEKSYRGEYGETNVNGAPADPQPMMAARELAIVSDMQSMGIDPALIYAFQHTGLLVTDATLDEYSDAQLLVWQTAVDRYRKLVA